MGPSDVCVGGGGGGGRDALEGKGPQRRAQKRLDRRWEEVAKAVGGGYCRFQMPFKLALGVRETVAGRRLGARGGCPPPSNASLAVGKGVHVVCSVLHRIWKEWERGAQGGRTVKRPTPSRSGFLSSCLSTAPWTVRSPHGCR